LSLGCLLGFRRQRAKGKDLCIVPFRCRNALHRAQAGCRGMLEDLVEQGEVVWILNAGNCLRWWAKEHRSTFAFVKDGQLTDPWKRPKYQGIREQHDSHGASKYSSEPRDMYAAPLDNMRLHRNWLEKEPAKQKLEDEVAKACCIGGCPFLAALPKSPFCCNRCSSRLRLKTSAAKDVLGDVSNPEYGHSRNCSRVKLTRWDRRINPTFFGITSYAAEHTLSLVRGSVGGRAASSSIEGAILGSGGGRKGTPALALAHTDLALAHTDLALADGESQPSDLGASSALVSGGSQPSDLGASSAIVSGGSQPSDLGASSALVSGGSRADVVLEVSDEEDCQKFRKTEHGRTKRWGRKSADVVAEMFEAGDTERTNAPDDMHAETGGVLLPKSWCHVVVMNEGLPDAWESIVGKLRMMQHEDADGGTMAILLLCTSRALLEEAMTHLHHFVGQQHRLKLYCTAEVSDLHGADRYSIVNAALALAQGHGYDIVELACATSILVPDPLGAFIEICDSDESNMVGLMDEDPEIGARVAFFSMHWSQAGFWEQGFRSQYYLPQLAFMLAEDVDVALHTVNFDEPDFESKFLSSEFCKIDKDMTDFFDLKLGRETSKNNDGSVIGLPTRRVSTDAFLLSELHGPVFLAGERLPMASNRVAAQVYGHEFDHRQRGGMANIYKGTLADILAKESAARSGSLRVHPKQGVKQPSRVPWKINASDLATVQDEATTTVKLTKREERALRKQITDSKWQLVRGQGGQVPAIGKTAASMTASSDLPLSDGESQPSDLGASSALVSGGSQPSVGIVQQDMSTSCDSASGAEERDKEASSGKDHSWGARSHWDAAGSEKWSSEKWSHWDAAGSDDKWSTEHQGHKSSTAAASNPWKNVIENDEFEASQQQALINEKNEAEQLEQFRNEAHARGEVWEDDWEDDWNGGSSWRADARRLGGARLRSPSPAPKARAKRANKKVDLMM
jgi:hypothetical protein